MATLRFQPMLESRPIREIAYEVLKHAIISGEIPAGDRIVETEYARQLHISRTPLREALRKLERDGLVEYVMRRGVVVRTFTLQDVEDIYNIRNALEMMTLPAVIARATAEDITELRMALEEMDRVIQTGEIDQLSVLARGFHTRLTAISRQTRVIRIIEGQDEYISRFSSMAIRQESRRPRAHEEHHALVDLIEKRDLAGLQALMNSHIERSKENCLKALIQQNSLSTHPRD